MPKKDAKQKQNQNGRKTPPKTRDGMSLQNAMEDLNMRFIINCPAEELASVERVFSQIEQAHWFYDDFYRAQHKHLPYLRMEAFSQAFVQRCPTLKHLLGLPNDEAVNSALRSFAKYKSKVPTCGCILLNSDMTQSVLVKGWIAGSSWGFPKGKMNADEPEIECAVREVLEETSFDAGPYITNPDTDFLEKTVKGQTVRMYIARNCPQDFHFLTQTRKEISQIKWFNVSAVAKNSIGSGERVSMTGQAFAPELLQWIELNKPEGSPKTGSKKSRNKKKKNNDAQPSSSDSSPRGSTAKDAKTSRNDKRRGSADSVTFTDTTRWTVDDMFAVNEAKFGIVNSFNLDEYSVPLPDAETQAKALEEYEKNQATRGKGGRARSGTSPTLQPATKQSKNGRRHSIGSNPDMAPSVANIFAMAGNGCLPPPPVPAPSKSTLELNGLQLPTSEGLAPAPSSCAATLAAPKFSFQFNTEEILSCI